MKDVAELNFMYVSNDNVIYNRAFVYNDVIALRSKGVI